MSTYTQILYQIVFCTYKRQKTLDLKKREELYKYIWGVLSNKKCHLYRIGGISDHIHILTHIHPSVSLASLVKDVKLSTNEYLKSSNIFTNFSGWQEGYGAFTYSIKDKERLINYIKNQEEHHKVNSYTEELKELLQEHGVDFDEKYLK